MNEIHRVERNLGYPTEASMSRGARFLHVGYQDGNVCVWVLADNLAEQIHRTFWTVLDENLLPPEVQDQKKYGFVGTAIGSLHLDQSYPSSGYNSNGMIDIRNLRHNNTTWHVFVERVDDEPLQPFEATRAAIQEAPRARRLLLPEEANQVPPGDAANKMGQ